MNYSHRLVISYYDTVSTLNEAHHVYMVRHRVNHSLAVRKELDIYNLKVYETLWDHPLKGTPRILAFDEQDGHLIIIEEYIEGHSLQEKIDAKNLTYEAVLYYSLELCRILDSMHSLNPPVIHRDIKPSNVIITPEGEVVLLDFNAAKQFHCDAKRDTVLLGTKGYAAPEQYGFGTSAPQTDIYGFGMLLKDMVSTLEPERYELDAIIQKCTRLDPIDRYTSVRDLEEALRVPTEATIKAHEAERDAKAVFSSQGEQSENKTSRFVRAASGSAGNAWVLGSNASGSAVGPADTISGAEGVIFQKGKSFRKRKNKPSSEYPKYPQYDPHWCGYLPPGFRSRKLTHMIVAVPVYLICLYIANGSGGGPYTRFGETFFNDASVFLAEYMAILVTCNYLNIQRLLPGCGSNRAIVRLLSVILWFVIAFLATLCLEAIIIARLYP